MRAGETEGAAVGRFAGYAAVFLMLYGAAGVAVHLRLLPILTGWPSVLGGSPDASGSTPGWGLLSPLQAHFYSLPWLAWLAWLVGLGLLGLRAEVGGARPVQPRPRWGAPNRAPFARWAVLALVLATVGMAGYLRLVQLVPPSKGISQFPYDDEGVYAGASQLFLQGILPYRDYFFAHPPLASFTYAPAMAYHFTRWGSPTSFMDARFLSVGYSLVTLVLLFAVASRLTGPVGGLIAGGLWALDGRVIEINRKVMLDGPMVLLSCGALLAYLWVRPVLGGQATGTGRGPARPLLVLGMAGALAALSALTKIAGAACFLAVLVDLLWLHYNNRRARISLAPLGPQLLSLFGGALLAALLALGPFMVLAPAQLLRQVVFFQLLRPSDGLIDVPARIADIAATYGNSLTAFSAALGFFVLTAALLAGVGRATVGPGRQAGEQEVARSSGATPWRAVGLWAFFSLLLFTYSRSFYGHYYIQLAAPLCLLGAGLGLLPALAGRLLRPAMPSWAPAAIRFVPVSVVILLALPFALAEWAGAHNRHEDRIFEIVGRYVSDAVQPETTVLTTDEQFNLLAARPPSRTSTGYLIDSYGHLIFYGLGLDRRDWGDLIGAALRGEHSNDAYAVMQLPAAQADFIERAASAPLVVLHQKGLPRLTPATIQTIEARARIVEQQPRYTILRAR